MPVLAVCTCRLPPQVATRKAAARRECGPALLAQRGLRERLKWTMAPRLPVELSHIAHTSRQQQARRRNRTRGRVLSVSRAKQPIWMRPFRRSMISSSKCLESICVSFMLRSCRHWHLVRWSSSTRQGEGGNPELHGASGIRIADSGRCARMSINGRACKS